jgi:hypothetical protein
MGAAAKAFSEHSTRHRHGLVKRLSLSAIMALSIGVPMAQAQVANNVPQTATSPLAQPKPAPVLSAHLAAYVNDPTDAPEIRALKNEFVKTDLGVMLMSFAQNHNIRFVMDSSLGARHSKAEYDPSNGTIAIRPGQKLEALVIYTAHEIRHGWQDKVLGAPGMERGVMTPWQRWTLRRYLEADAEAFASYFEADRMRDGVHIGPGFANAVPASNIAMRLRGEFMSKDGLTFEKYRKLAFEPCLAALFTYNARQLDLIDDMTLEFGKKVTAAGNDQTKLAALDAAVKSAPTTAQFANYLRHFGGVSFDPHAQTSLVNKNIVTDETLLADYPRREAREDVRATFYDNVLDPDIQKMTDLQNSYIQLLRDSVKPASKPSGFRPGS